MSEKTSPRKLLKNFILKFKIFEVDFIDLVTFIELCHLDCVVVVVVVVVEGQEGILP